MYLNENLNLDTYYLRNKLFQMMQPVGGWKLIDFAYFALQINSFFILVTLSHSFVHFRFYVTLLGPLGLR
jgi:hypothetical protein